MAVNDLRQLMIEKISCYLPVLEGEMLMGVISFLDVAKAVLEEQKFSEQNAEELHQKLAGKRPRPDPCGGRGAATLFQISG